MQFIYRGVKYDRQPSGLKVREGEVAGKYRGQTWNRHVNTERPQTKPAHQLKYRGISFSG